LGRWRDLECESCFSFTASVRWTKEPPSLPILKQEIRQAGGGGGDEWWSAESLLRFWVLAPPKNARLCHAVSPFEFN
jgi:hypothetical protein